MDRNVLYGNGLNIEFSGNDDFKNYAIIDRMNKNMSISGRYKEVFGNVVDAEELSIILNGIYKWFKNTASKGINGLQWIENEDELQNFMRMCKAYEDAANGLLSIGLEDYLLILKLFDQSYKEQAVGYQILYQGITQLMLDSLYDEGKIQELYKNMSCLKSELEKYTGIFTLNYDTNLDKLTTKKIYHLHGSFENLHHEYRGDTLKGWAIQQSGKSLQQYIKGKEYIYCDALFGFSGQDKMQRIIQYNQIYENPICETLRKAHPELDMPRYPIKEFREMKGTLDIIGMNPNNDSHIFEMINENKSISKVVYYAFGGVDGSQANTIRKIIEHPVEIEDVEEYWKRIR